VGSAAPGPEGKDVKPSREMDKLLSDFEELRCVHAGGEGFSGVCTLVGREKLITVHIRGFCNCRSKHQELEAALDQKETEKQLIFSEMLQSKQRQELLEQRLAKMVEVLMKACQSMGIGALENQELRGMHQQITNDGGPVDPQRRFKRARLTGDPNAYKTHSGEIGSALTRSSDYTQTDEWLDSLMQGMSRVADGKSQGGYGGHQMRITNSHGSFTPQFPSSTMLTEIHEGP
jgi:hypothetical protein